MDKEIVFYSERDAVEMARALTDNMIVRRPIASHDLRDSLRALDVYYLECSDPNLWELREAAQSYDFVAPNLAIVVDGIYHFMAATIGEDGSITPITVNGKPIRGLNFWLTYAQGRSALKALSNPAQPLTNPVKVCFQVGNTSWETVGNSRD